MGHQIVPFDLLFGIAHIACNRKDRSPQTPPNASTQLRFSFRGAERLQVISYFLLGGGGLSETAQHSFKFKCVLEICDDQLPVHWLSLRTSYLIADGKII
jgi:hypothetical protein